MLVKHLACNSFVNVSEEIAFLAVRKYLSGLECRRRAVVITNLANAIGNTGARKGASAPLSELP